jgi:hypothetical protein
MRKLLIATAAVTLAASFAGTSIAAPQAKSQFCKLANSQRNPVAWNAYYHCNPTAAAKAETVGAAPQRQTKTTTKDPHCAMASQQRNPVSWNEYYHCR